MKTRIFSEIVVFQIPTFDVNALTLEQTMQIHRFKHSRVTIITNGSLFNKKLQPIKWFYTFFGLISYNMNGTSFRRVPWYGKVYLLFLSTGISYIISNKLINFWKRDAKVTLRHLGISCLYVSSILHIVSTLAKNKHA